MIIVAASSDAQRQNIIKKTEVIYISNIYFSKHHIKIVTKEFTYYDNYRY